MLILAGDGTGGFAPAGQFPTVRSSILVDAVDLSGDGLDDLVTVSYAEDAVGWLLNQGDGTLAEHRIISVGDRPVAIAAGDFDGDGDLEIATAVDRDQEIRILDNQGSGDLSPGSTLPLGALTRDLAVGDFDHNGWPDLAASSFDGLRIYRSQGDGSFTSARFYANRLGKLRSDDIDGDGFSDLLAADLVRDSIVIYQGTGTGEMRPPQRFLFDYATFTVDDLDADGDLDLILARADPDSVVVQTNGEVPHLFMEGFDLPALDRPHFTDTGDFNADGVAEIVTVNGGDRSYTIFLGRGDGTFPGGVKRSDEQHPAWAVQAADFNGDGADDLVHRNGTELNVLFSHGDGTFSDRVPYATPGGAHFLLVADLDDDGSIDLLAPTSRGVSVHYNDGEGALQERLDLPGGNATVEVAVADLDGDGRLDIATANFISSDVSVLLAASDRTYRPAITIPIDGGEFGPAGVAGIAAADLDRDGDVDLATANQESKAASVLLNQGGAVFAPARSFPLGRAPRALIAADLDGDGFEDLIATNEREDSITILRGLGAGAFSTPQYLPVKAGPRVTAKDDLDGDGDIDLVVAGRVGHSVSVRLNRQPAQNDGVDALPRVCTPLDLASISVPDTNAVVERRTTYLVPSRDEPRLLAPLFPNSSRFPLQRDFLATTFPERFMELGSAGYTNLVARRKSRDYFSGSIRQVRTAAGVVYAFDVLTEVGEVTELLTAAETEEVFRRIEQVFALRPLAYVPSTRAAFDLASDWSNTEFPLLLLEDALEESDPNGGPLANPEFELEIAPETTLCGVFGEANASRGPREELLFKSTVKLRAGTFALPTRNDSFEGELFEHVTFGPGAAVARPLASGTFRVTRIPAADGVTTYRFTYSQDFVLSNGRILELVAAAPLQYRARGEVPLQRAAGLPDTYFSALTGREALQATIDGTPSVQYGSCTYEDLPRSSVEFELADGTVIRLVEHFEEAESEFETAPATVRRAEVFTDNAHRTITSYYDLVYSAYRHNTRVTYWVVLDPPLPLGGRDVNGIELRAPDPLLRPEAEASYLDTRLNPVAPIAVSHFRREPLTAPIFKRGDADANGRCNLLDVIKIVSFLFRDGPDLACHKAADADDDGRLSIVDPITLVGKIFADAILPGPFSECGRDPTDDSLPCDTPTPCPE